MMQVMEKEENVKRETRMCQLNRDTFKKNTWHLSPEYCDS